MKEAGDFTYYVDYKKILNTFTFQNTNLLKVLVLKTSYIFLVFKSPDPPLTHSTVIHIYLLTTQNEPLRFK